jgi:hypothetical protein
MATHNETMLTAIKAALEGRITSDMEQYQIQGRQITKIPIDDLIKLKIYYEGEVNKEVNAANIKAGKTSGRIIHTRLTKP